MRRIHLFILLLFAMSVNISAHGKAEIREVNFYNRTFPFTVRAYQGLPRRIRVLKGVYHSPHQESSLTYSYFKVVEVAFGDLNGDDQDEAAVVAIYGGASSDFYETSIYLYTMEGHRPKLLAILNQESIGKEYEHFSHDGRSYLFEATAGGTRIEHERLTVKHLAGGAHCCAPNVFSLRYRLKNNRLVIANESLRKKYEREGRILHSAEDR
jgi:hypothetical protein